MKDDSCITALIIKNEGCLSPSLSSIVRRVIMQIRVTDVTSSVDCKSDILQGRVPSFPFSLHGSEPELLNDSKWPRQRFNMYREVKNGWYVVW